MGFQCLPNLGQNKCTYKVCLLSENVTTLPHRFQVGASKQQAASHNEAMNLPGKRQAKKAIIYSCLYQSSGCRGDLVRQGSSTTGLERAVSRQNAKCVSLVNGNLRIQHRATSIHLLSTQNMDMRTFTEQMHDAGTGWHHLAFTKCGTILYSVHWLVIKNLLQGTSLKTGHVHPRRYMKHAPRLSGTRPLAESKPQNPLSNFL